MRLEILVAEADAARYAGTITLDEYVHLAHEADDHVATLRRLEVDANPLHAAAAAVGMEHRFHGIDARSRDRRDLDDAHAVVRKNARGPRGGPDGGQVEAGEALQRGHVAGLQKFFGKSSLRLAMMFFWISEDPPPIVSITV